MNRSERAVPAGCRWLLRAAAGLVPEDVRRDWHREWRAELDWAAAQHDARTGQRFTDGRLMMRCAGACAHAVWLRWDRWRPDMWSYDLKIAARSLWRQPGFVALAVLTLAVGIGANAAIFSAVQAVLLRPLPFPDAHQLVAVFTTGPKLRPGESSPPDFVDWHGAQGSLTGGLAALTADSFAMTGRSSAEQVPGASVTGDFFAVLGVSPLRGRTLEPRDARAGASPVVVLGHGLWVRRFGQAPEVIGSTVIVDGVPREVVGILPPGREYPLGSELWVPLTFTEQDLATQRGALYLDVIGRLGPDVPMARAQGELSGIAQRLAAAYQASSEGRDVVVRDLRASLVGDVRPALLMLLVAAGLVLVIVCANVAGLLLTRAIARSHDVAVRTALGASRGRLVRGALVESVLLGIAGGGVGLVLAWMGARGIATLDASLGIPRMATTRVDGVVVAVTAAVSVLSAVVFGVAPAWRAMAFADVARRVRAAGPRLSRSRGRGALVIAEVAVALVLVVGALTLVRSFGRLTSVDLGFEATEHVQTFAVTLPDARYGTVADREHFIDQLLTRLRGLPGVQSAGAVFGMPLTGFGYSISVFERDGVSVPDTPEDMMLLGVRAASPGYFRTMGTALRRGRDFASSDGPDGPAVVIVNESAAKLLWPDVDPIGRHVTLGTRLIQGPNRPRAGGQVVGIVADTLDAGAAARPRPMLFVALAQFPTSFLAVAVRNAPGGPTVATLHEVMASIDPDVPMFRVRTTAELAASSVAQPRLLMLLLGLFAGAALLVAAIGLYGVLAQSVAVRFKEIGIRRAVGATTRDIAGLVAGESVRLVSTGVAIGLVASLGLNNVVSTFVFDATSLDAATYLGAVVAFAAVSAIAAFAPCARALAVDPAQTLKAE